MKKDRDMLELGLVIFCSVFFLSIALVLCLVGNTQGSNRAIGTVLWSAWAFSIIPAFVWTFQHLGKMELFDDGWLWWLWYPVFHGGVIAAIIAAPFLCVAYYWGYIFTNRRRTA